ncbi:hypothetical protein D3C79_886370 [compost metagenome]
MEVGAAGIQQLGETLGPAPGIRLVEQLEQGRWLEFERDVDMGVQIAHQQRQIPAVVRYPEPFAEIPNERQPLLAVAVVARPERGGRQPLAEVVAQGGEAHRQLGGEATGLIQHHQGVDACVDLRVPLGGCRYPEQGVQLGEQRLEGAAFP